MKHSFIAALLAAAFLTSATYADEQAPLPAIMLASAVARNAGDFVVGYRFALEKPMRITALGLTDEYLDGILNASAPVQIAIWDESGKEIARAQVPPSTRAENDAFYVNIEPVDLAVGKYVIGALTRANEEGFFFNAEIKTVPGLKMLTGLYRPGTSLVCPTQDAGVDCCDFGPVFKVLPSSQTQPALQVKRPAERSIHQRDGRGMGSIPMELVLAEKTADSIDVRALDYDSKLPAGDWAKIKNGENLELPAGWYRLEFRAIKDGSEVATAKVEPIGVGEVFVTCGQSNSANHGAPVQRAKSERVSSCDFKTGNWKHSDDPQPGASGGGGSPWPLLGDILAEKYRVPVGFICIGVGSTPVSFWTPQGQGYQKLKQALDMVGRNGCRAVLWHQGESDSIAGTSADKYAECSEPLSPNHARIPVGRCLGVLQSGILLSEPRSNHRGSGRSGRRTEKVASTVPGVFPGPTTDGFRERGFLHDGVHFNAQGLTAHAQGWADSLAGRLP
jgi:hypothetical protein